MLNKKFDSLELPAFILIIFWCLNPIIVYYMQYNCMNSVSFTKLSIYIIGICGYIYFILNKIFIKKENNFKIKDNIPLIIILFMMIWSIISTLLASNKSIAILGESYRNEGLIIYFLYVGFILLASFIKNKKLISYILNTIIFSALSIVTISLITTYNFNNIITRGYSNIFNNFNHYGYYLLISTTLSLLYFIKEDNKIKKIIYLIVYSYLTYFFIANNTFGCYLAFIISIMLLLIYSIVKKWKIKSTIMSIIIFILLSFIVKDSSGKVIAKYNINEFYNDIKTVLNVGKDTLTNNKINDNDIDKLNNTGSNRMLIWKEAIILIKNKPIFGGGIECLKEYYDSKFIAQDRPHNMIIQIAAFIGIPGAIAYLVLLIYLAFITIKDILKNKNIDKIIIFLAAISYFISSLFGNSMYYTSPYYMILLGFLIYVNKK